MTPNFNKVKVDLCFFADVIYASTLTLLIEQ
jgi:hypothetical protein